MELNKDLYIDNVKDYLEDGKQLFNKDTARDGYGIVKSSGAITAENTQCYSDFIPAKPNTSYAFNINFSSNNFGVTFYNSSKTYLSGLSYNEIGNGKTFTTPANTAYIIMTIKIANKDTFMLNKGPSVLPYEEYYGKYLNKADITKNGIEVYSTDEIIIGTWLHKPLYRKVFVINATIPSNSASSSGTVTIFNKSTYSADEVFIKSCKIDNSDNSVSIYVPYAGGQPRYIGISRISNDINVGFFNAFSNENVKITSIIEYTKTTD